MSTKKLDRISRRAFLKLAGTSTLTGLLAAACAGIPTPAVIEKVVTATPAPQKVTLKVLTHTGGVAPMEDSLEPFIDENPGITFEVSGVPESLDYVPAIMALRAARAPLDVMYVNGDVFLAFLENGLMLDLTDYGKANNLFSRVKEDLYYTYWSDSAGRRYTLPLGTGYVLGYWYNQALFDKYSLKPPETLEELKEVGKTFLENGVIPIGQTGKFCMGISANIEFFMDELAGNKGTEFVRDCMEGRKRWDDPIWVEAVKYSINLANGSLFGDEWLGWDYDNMMAVFLNGKAAMIAEGNWSYASFSENEQENPDIFKAGFMRPVQLPGAPGKGRCEIAPANGWAIYAETKHVEESLKVLEFVSRPAFTSQSCQNAKSVLSPYKDAECPGDDPLKFREYFDEGFTFANWQMGPKVSDQFYCQGVLKLHAGQPGTVEEELAKVQKWWEEELAKKQQS